MQDVNEINVKIGNNMRLLRRNKGLTQEEIAEWLGVTFQQVQKYETGTNRISAQVLYQLKPILGVEYDDFFSGLEGDDEPIAPPPPMDYDLILIETVQQFIQQSSRRKKQTLIRFIQEFLLDNPLK